MPHPPLLGDWFPLYFSSFLPLLGIPLHILFPVFDELTQKSLILGILLFSAMRRKEGEWEGDRGEGKRGSGRKFIDLLILFFPGLPSLLLFSETRLLSCMIP